MSTKRSAPRTRSWAKLASLKTKLSDFGAASAIARKLLEFVQNDGAQLISAAQFSLHILRRCAGRCRGPLQLHMASRLGQRGGRSSGAVQSAALAAPILMPFALALAIPAFVRSLIFCASTFASEESSTIRIFRTNSLSVARCGSV